MLKMLVMISPLEWVIIGLGIAVVTGYIAYSVYRHKHPKQKKEDNEE